LGKFWAKLEQIFDPNFKEKVLALEETKKAERKKNIEEGRKIVRKRGKLISKKEN